MNPAKRRAIYETLSALNPNPTTELLYTTPFELLVAVVLSAQATDKGVNAATRVLFKIANTPQALAQARRRTAFGLYPFDRLLSGQGAQRDPAVAGSGRATRRRGSARS